MPFRIMTASATSQPPAEPTQPGAVAHGGSMISSTVPTAMQSTAADIEMANTRAAAFPPGVLRTEIQVGSAVAHHSAINSSGCDVRNTARVAAAPKRMRATADGSRARRGATSRIAISTKAT